MNKLKIKGFEFDSSEGMYWNADGTLGLVEEDDGKWRLLNSECYPSDHSMREDYASHLLARRAGEDPLDVFTAWDDYASTIGGAQG